MLLSTWGRLCCGRLANGAALAPPVSGYQCQTGSDNVDFDRTAGCRAAAEEDGTAMAPATLTINSKNYGSWSLRGWLLCKMAGLDFEEQQARSDDPSTRTELLLLSPSFLVPCLTHHGVKPLYTLAIAEYRNTPTPHPGLT